MIFEKPRKQRQRPQESVDVLLGIADGWSHLLQDDFEISPRRKRRRVKIELFSVVKESYSP